MINVGVWSLFNRTLQSEHVLGLITLTIPPPLYIHDYQLLRKLIAKSPLCSHRLGKAEPLEENDVLC